MNFRYSLLLLCAAFNIDAAKPKMPHVISSFAGVILDNSSSVAIENGNSKSRFIAPPRSTGFFPAHQLIVGPAFQKKNIASSWDVIQLQEVGSPFTGGPLYIQVSKQGNIIIDLMGKIYTEKDFPTGAMATFLKNRGSWACVISINDPKAPVVQGLVRLNSTEIQTLRKNGKEITRYYPNISSSLVKKNTSLTRRIFAAKGTIKIKQSKPKKTKKKL